jgi:NAD-dependent deacetylase
MGIVKAVITQNVDTLHQRAGSRRVLELHGSMTKLDCLDCRKEYDWSDFVENFEKREVPRCKACGSWYVKPRVVLFGEPLPMDVLEQAVEEARSADVFIVVGSSLVVYPAAELPYIAKSCGARMILVNAEPTVADHIFDVRIYGRAGEILPRIVEVVKSLKQNS